MLLQKCIKAFADSQAALKTWRPVAKALGLGNEDIAAIAGAPHLQEITFDQAKEMFTKWHEIRGQTATKDSLIVVLRKLKLDEAAGKLA